MYHKDCPGILVDFLRKWKVGNFLRSKNKKLSTKLEVEFKKYPKPETVVLYRGLYDIELIDSKYIDDFPSSWSKSLETAKSFIQCGGFVISNIFTSENILLEIDQVMYSKSDYEFEVIIKSGNYHVDVVYIK